MMKKSSAQILQTVLIVLAVAAAGVLLWEPHLEGRNLGAGLTQIYFGDPFLAYIYVASLAFFIGLYQAIRFLGLAGQGKVYSPQAVKCVKTISTCAIAMIGLVAVAEIIILMNTEEDRAGGVAMGGMVIVGSIAVAVAASLIARALQRHGAQVAAN